MRNRLSGTAVTESETLFLAPVIPNKFDKAEAFQNKVDRLKNVPLQELNSLRNSK
jgi:hypothetical protein